MNLIMLSATLVCSTSQPAQPLVMTLQRQTENGSEAHSYVAVQDTFLDSKNPERNYGRDLMLSGGPDKVILIQFSELARQIPPDKKIKNAKLILHIEAGDTIALKSIGRMLVPWGEGPSRRGDLSFLTKPTDPKQKEQGPKWAATWRHRRAGERALSWQKAGAQGSQDQERIESASLKIQGDDLFIEGLGAALQRMYERPWDNHGFALQFANEVEFASSEPWSQGSKFAPKFEITLEDATPQKGADLTVESIFLKQSQGNSSKWVATVRNKGDAPAKGFRATWWVREQSTQAVDGAASLQPGETQTFEINLDPPSGEKDPRTWPLGFVIEPFTPDAKPQNNGLIIYSQGMPVHVVCHPKTSTWLKQSLGVEEAASSSGVIAWLQSVLDHLNSSVFPHSRYSFAPQGVIERLRLQSFSISETPPSTELSTTPEIRIFLNEQTIMPFIPTPRALPENNPLRLADPKHLEDIFHEMIFRALGVEVQNEILAQDFLDFRDDGWIPPKLSLPEEGWPNQLLTVTPMPRGGGISRAQVGILNETLGLPPAEKARYSAMPNNVMLRLLDSVGEPVRGARIELFEAQKIVDEARLAQLDTNPEGGALLPRKATETGTRESFFEGIDRRSFVTIRVTKNGVSEYAFLPIARVMEEVFRGNKSFAFIDLHVNLPGGSLDTSVDLALSRGVTDSKNSFPAQLAPLVDGNEETSVSLEEMGEGYWFEIDLGRDRPVGEIVFWRPKSGYELPEQFDILVYNTGQKPSEARLWAAERGLSKRRRVQNLVSGLLRKQLQEQLNYRGPAQRVRYIRVVFRKSPRLAGPAQVNLPKIKVIPLKAE